MMQQVIDRATYPTVSVSNSSLQRSLAAIAGLLLGIIFLVSGGWKVFNPIKTGELLEQAQVHAGWGVLGAATLGTIELLAAVLLFLPRYRRWGGILGTALLVFFMGWVRFYYSVLAGAECSCFPYIKRTIGPMFFVSDGVMLLLGLAAWAWSARVRSIKIPAMVLATLAIAAGASYGVRVASLAHVQVPNPVMVDGKPADLTHGIVFLFFYDPSCMHCDAAARFMSGFDWKDTRLVSIPTVNPQWAPSFLRDTHLKASTSLDLEKLRKAFPFVDPPFGVVLKEGAVQQTFGQAQFNAPSPKRALESFGLIR